MRINNNFTSFNTKKANKTQNNMSNPSFGIITPKAQEVLDSLPKEIINGVENWIMKRLKWDPIVIMNDWGPERLNLKFDSFENTSLSHWEQAINKEGGVRFSPKEEGQLKDALDTYLVMANQSRLELFYDLEKLSKEHPLSKEDRKLQIKLKKESNDISNNIPVNERDKKELIGKAALDKVLAAFNSKVRREPNMPTDVSFIPSSATDCIFRDY